MLIYVAEMMNFISGTHAVSLFPVPAFISALGEMLPNVKGDLGNSSCYTKRNERLHNTRVTGQVAEAAETGSRFVGDTRCWMIPFRKSRKYLFVTKKKVELGMFLKF